MGAEKGGVGVQATPAPPAATTRPGVPEPVQVPPEVSTPAKVPEAEPGADWPDHVIDVTAIGSQPGIGGHVFRAECSCGWKGDVASTYFDLAVEPARLHVERVDLFSKPKVEA